MEFSSSISPILLSFFLLLSSASAFNITRILEQYPDFSTFSSLLNQTGVADDINHRQTITVLAVDNGAVGAISGNTQDIQKRILSVHVVLDYYDEEKLKKIRKNSTVLTTLFQSSGMATNQQGFLKVTKDPSSGQTMFASDVPGTTSSASLVKEVMTRPYNISVLQLSSIIFPEGIDGGNSTAHPPPPPPPPKKAPSPKGAPSPKADAPKADAPEADAPAADAPEADAPAADAPEADGPAADGPAADGPDAADGPEADASGSTVTRVEFSTCLGAMLGLVWVFGM